MATNTAHLRPFFQASKRFFAKSISESTHDGSSAEMFFADATAAALNLMRPTLLSALRVIPPGVLFDGFRELTEYQANTLAKLAGSGKSVCRNRDIIADYFGRRGFNLVYIHTERTYDGRLHLMRVNYEINLGAKTICLGMNALFG